MTPIDSLLFDVDGTLVNSNDQHARAWVDALAEFDLDCAYETLRSRIGMGGDNILSELFSLDPDSKQSKTIRKRRDEIFKTKYLSSLSAFDGAADLLHTLKAKGYRLVIATSASSDDLKAILRQAKLDGIVDEATSSSDAKHSKPDPDIIDAAIKKSKLSPVTSLMVGDTPYDIEAAKRAGVKCVGFTCGGWPEAKLKEAGAIAVFENPASFLTELKASRFPF